MIPKHDSAPADDRVLEFSYTVVFEPGAEGGFIASVPAFAGLTIQGDTLQEARTMARQAIEECLAALIKHGEEIPTDSNLAHIERIAVNV
jgi:antitoxin HicB